MLQKQWIKDENIKDQIIPIQKRCKKDEIHALGKKFGNFGMNC